MQAPIAQQVPLRPPQASATTTLRLWPSPRPRRTAALLLAPGAGSTAWEPTLSAVAAGLAARGVPVGVFQFAYQQAGRRPPDRVDRLERAFVDVHHAFAAQVDAARVVVGGRSLGGRVASRVAAGGVGHGVVALAYPLRPARRDHVDPRRTAHWPDITVPVLFVHGDRDRLCPTDGLEQARRRCLTGADARVHVVAGADHGFAVRRRDAVTGGQVLAEVIDVVDDWLLTAVEAMRHG